MLRCVALCCVVLCYIALCYVTLRFFPSKMNTLNILPKKSQKASITCIHRYFSSFSIMIGMITSEKTTKQMLISDFIIFSRSFLRSSFKLNIFKCILTLPTSLTHSWGSHCNPGTNDLGDSFHGCSLWQTKFLAIFIKYFNTINQFTRKNLKEWNMSQICNSAQNKPERHKINVCKMLLTSTFVLTEGYWHS